MSIPVLYAHNLSSCSWRVRIALAHKGIDHKIKVVNSTKNETSKEEYLKINPMGRIPALQVDDDGTVIAESMAILEYLEETYPQIPLLPQNPVHRGKVREICEIIVSGIQPLQGPRVAAHYSDNPEKQSEWTLFYLNKGFKALEEILKKTSATKKFCFGNSLTLADACLIPQVYFAVHRFKVKMEPYPTIVSIFGNVMELEAVRQGHPQKEL